MEAFVTGIKEKYCGNLTMCDMWLYPHQRPKCLVPLKLAVTEDGEQRILAYDSLFSGNHEGSLVKRVLIEGGAGMGKTSFCVSVSQKWANGKLFQEYQLLLRLPLCQTAIAAATSFPMLLEAVFGSSSIGTSLLAVSHEIRVVNKGQGLLIVADGWDKLEMSKRRKGSFFYNLLFGNLLRYASVVVTSRSSACAPLHKGTRHVKLLGFHKISEYVHHEFCKEHQFESGEKLLKEVEHNPLLKSICDVPLVCCAVCFLWHTLAGKFPSSMADLCAKVMFSVVQRNLHNCQNYLNISCLTDVDNFPDSLKDAWWNMCQISFESIIHKNEIALQGSISAGIETFGLMEFVRNKQGMSPQFILPAFQECLAAVHVTRQQKNTQLKQLLAIKSKQLCVFWRFFFENHLKNIIDVNFLKIALRMLSCEVNSACLRSTVCCCAFEAKSKVIDKEVIKVLCVKKQGSDVIVYFGEPQTTYDCDAIIYVIDKVHDFDCDGIEINFNGCGLQEKQVMQLARALHRKQSALPVEGIDLSNNRLSDKILTQLFVSAQPSFKSLKKIFLRSSKLSSNSLSAVIAAFSQSSSPNVVQLDLSLNPLSACDLQVLHDAVISDRLTSLEILLLQGSLTTDANANVRFFVSFIDALCSHCQYLRQLDLSDNDLGKPESSLISDMISKLFRLNKKLDLRLSREYMLEVKDKFIAIMEDSVKQKGTIDHTIVHGVIVGPGRSGKNSLMSRLMGEEPLDPCTISPSTGVLENVVKLEVMKRCTVATSVNNLIWRRLNYDEEALELMMTTAKNHSSSTTSEHNANSVCERVSSAVVVVDQCASESISTVSVITDVVNITDGAILLGSSGDSRRGSMIDQEEPVLGTMNNSFKHEGPLDIFKRAVKLRHMDGLRDHLESSWSLYLTNTGGQMEFQELLPVFLCGPSLFFVTFPLHHDLDKKYTVRYQHKDGSECTYESPSTLMEEILQTLATIAALDCTVPDVNAKLVPKIVFVGTHKDELKDASAIKEIDKKLQAKIRQTSLFHQGSFEFAVSCKQLIFAVNNLDKDDADFKKIRLNIQRIVERCEDFTVQCPSTWLIFSLVLRAKHKSQQVLSYEDCYIIARHCGVSDRVEFNQALFYIHSRLGLLRYFPVEGLNALVVTDPQILFDSISKFIVETFTEDHAVTNEIEEFRYRGVFSMEAIERISRKTQSGTHKLPLKWLLNLLNHLRIAAFYVDKKGEHKCFFPALLCHAPKQNITTQCLKSTIKLPHHLLIAFKSGFCPRGIPGALIKYLMTNEMRSSTSWKLHQSRIYKNQVSLGVGPCDVVIKILPTHIQIYFDPESQPCDQKEVESTCIEAYTHLEQAMESVTKTYYNCQYYFAFNCERLDCTFRPHPAEIDFKHCRLYCQKTDRRCPLPDACIMWFLQRLQGMLL